MSCSVRGQWYPGVEGLAMSLTTTVMPRSDAQEHGIDIVVTSVPPATEPGAVFGTNGTCDDGSREPPGTTSGERLRRRRSRATRALGGQGRRRRPLPTLPAARVRAGPPD